MTITIAAAPGFHPDDEVELRNITDDRWVHGIVHEVCASCVWVSVDDCFCDVPVDPTSDRIRMHESTVA